MLLDKKFFMSFEPFLNHFIIITTAFRNILLAARREHDTNHMCIPTRNSIKFLEMISLQFMWPPIILDKHQNVHYSHFILRRSKVIYLFSSDCNMQRKFDKKSTRYYSSKSSTNFAMPFPTKNFYSRGLELEVADTITKCRREA